MEQRNSAAANTRLRHTDWHALWSSSYAGAWCTPCSKGTFPLVNPLRGNIPLVGVHFSALLAPVTVLLYGAKTWQLVVRGYPETFSYCRNEIMQHPCGNGTRDDRRQRA